MIFENHCAFCRGTFQTNAVSARYCPRCRRLRRLVRQIDALRRRRESAWRAIANIWYDLCRPRQAWRERGMA